MRRNREPSEYNEHGRYIEVDDVRERTQMEQHQVEDLMERGFLWEQAVKLVQLHEHIYENSEVRQRVEEDDYMQFARWLYEHGEINEEVDGQA